MTRKHQNDFWSVQGDFIYRHHVEPRVQFFVPKEESFLIPLKYIDVIRSTHTDLDVAQENELITIGMSTETEICRLRDRFHEIHIIERNSSKRIYVVPGETDKIPNDITSRSHGA